ncbi:thiolase family protein [Thermogymnomonas acidicola]|nr:thiolase family protein [Thermogymnomonas acidicola]
MGPTVAGYGQFIERKSSLSSMEIFARASSEAMGMAGLSPGDIDGFLFATTPGCVEPPERMMLADQVAGYLGLHGLGYMEHLDIGGASFNAMVFRAARAVDAGLARNVLVLGGGKGSMRKEAALAGHSYERYYTPAARAREYLPLSDYAILTSHYNTVNGGEDRGRAMIAVRERENANLNGGAFFRGPLDADDILESPVVSDPLHLLECASPSDGASAFIVSSSAGSDCSVSILSYSEAHDPRPLFERPEMLKTPAHRSIPSAMSAAGVSAGKVDLVMLYDAFTTMVMLEVEAAGLAERGKGWKYAEENSFGPESSTPINTNGGTLNTTQPAFMSGGVILHEALEQLCGRAGRRQVKGAQRAMVNAIGGIMNHSTTIVLGV